MYQFKKRCMKFEVKSLFKGIISSNLNISLKLKRMLPSINIFKNYKEIWKYHV